MGHLMLSWDTSCWCLPPHRHLILAIATSWQLETPHTDDCHLVPSRDTSYWRLPPRAILRHLILAIATSCNLETPRTGDCHLVQSQDTSYWFLYKFFDATIMMFP
ncbi:hypothetical protein AMTR_s00026p00029840 [Amborella trichopoda]|uniref:Uncharacterized protein n=1 Tax=Amborella trichopoda TaxID=13333 RepID=W1PQJ9_AMBTC|nr:hypothetical protein AMTR_s00026p00029840 [Amborella trichopoda]